MRLVTIGVYTLCLLAGVGIWAWSRRHPEGMAPAGRVVEEILSARPARITLLVFWWWLGWHFLAS